ncbi:hypothetical protein ZHAS_00006191 [Anopheles sinensis]|uniref:Uncharacterized protein n=1 Tax=Anopheles sinensis TaxID=74873 RepID=A0A084VLE7_ANOSI|nr:hypothetical protein ZHAS_00006191 [Anopheles sinensis]
MTQRVVNRAVEQRKAADTQWEVVRSEKVIPILTLRSVTLTIRQSLSCVDQTEVIATLGSPHSIPRRGIGWKHDTITRSRSRQKIHPIQFAFGAPYQPSARSAMGERKTGRACHEKSHRATLEGNHRSRPAHQHS